MRLIFSTRAWTEYVYWQTQDRKTLLKINKLILSIVRDGAMIGEGKPERLKYGQAYSRRIDDKNRLVYTIDNDEILIESCLGHYEK